MNYPERGKRIALLIDADNSPANKIDLILTELATLGVANVRRAYGNWKKDALKGWEKLLHEHAIRPMQQFDYSKGKNASDMAMVIDALELLYTDRPDAFGIVSSDADFTPLVMHLRAKGADVYGFGNQQTPKPFANACSQFLYLDKVESSGSGAQAQRMSGAQLKQDAKLVSLLRHAVQAAAGEEGWAMAGNVSQQIRNQAPFDARNYGYASFSRLLEATQLFELKREGSVAWVRERREERGERVDKSDRADKADRGERVERVERGERSERSERSERGRRPERNAPQPRPAPTAVPAPAAEPVPEPAADVGQWVAALMAEPEAHTDAATAPAPEPAGKARRAPRKKAAAPPAPEAAASSEPAAKPRRSRSKPKPDAG